MIDKFYKFINYINENEHYDDLYQNLMYKCDQVVHIISNSEFYRMYDHLKVNPNYINSPTQLYSQDDIEYFLSELNKIKNLCSEINDELYGIDEKDFTNFKKSKYAISELMRIKEFQQNSDSLRELAHQINVLSGDFNYFINHY